MSATLSAPVIRDLTAEDVFAKAVCMTLSLHKIGLQRKSAIKLKSKADQNMFRTTKLLIDCPEYRAILRLDSQIRRELHQFDLPGDIGRGMALVPATALQRASQLADDFRVRRAALIDDFCRVYPERKDDARQKLMEEFKENEYPTVKEIRESFKFDIQFMTFDLPGVLSVVDETMAEREREKMAEKFKTIGEEIRDGLRELMQGLVTHLLDRLNGQEDGKPKKLMPSAITNLMGFLQEFDGQNVSRDSELEKLVAQLKNTLQGVTPKSLKKDENYRAIVTTSLQSVKSQLDTLMVDKPTRRILVSRDHD